MSYGTEGENGRKNWGISVASTGKKIQNSPEIEKLAADILKEVQSSHSSKDNRVKKSPAKSSHKAKSRVKRTVISLMLLVLSAVVIFVAIEITNVINIFSSVNYVSPTSRTSNADLFVDQSYVQLHVSHTDETKNILLIGYDVEEDGFSRSDSMIILSLDHNHKKIKLTSLMRDMYVRIPQKGKHKINAAYVYGGGDLLLNTIYANFGLDIDKYVSVDYGVFAEIVDCVGGVQIHLADAELEQFNKYVSGKQNRIYEAGTYNMNGKQALAYCRIRKVGTDTARTARQRKVLDKIINKCRSMSFGELEVMMAKLAPKVTTNLTKNEMMSLMAEGFVSLNYETSNMRIPADGTWQGKYINKVWYMTFDLEKNAQYLNDFIYGDDEISDPLANKLKENDTAAEMEFLQ